MDKLIRLSDVLALLPETDTVGPKPSALRAAVEALPGGDIDCHARRGKWVKKHRHRGGFEQYTGVDSMGETHTITVDERYEIDDLYCSECGRQSADNFLHYCPNCGAKMDGGDENPPQP